MTSYGAGILRFARMKTMSGTYRAQRADGTTQVHVIPSDHLCQSLSVGSIVVCNRTLTDLFSY
jgi:hypothetical protein